VLFEAQILNKSKILKPLAYIGKYSYPLYLFHPWAISIAKHTSSNIYIFLFSYIFIAFFIGVSLSKLIEYPFLKYRDKRIPSNS
jgi:peptidoglycan/LPS O-acetylase OafA/YrhL